MNVSVGQSTIGQMLPQLCIVAGKVHQTNHCLR